MLIFERVVTQVYFFSNKLVKLVDSFMKNTKLVLILLVIFSSIVAAGCSSERGIGGSSKKCGCGISKGMSGY